MWAYNRLILSSVYQFQNIKEKYISSNKPSRQYNEPLLEFSILKSVKIVYWTSCNIFVFSYNRHLLYYWTWYIITYFYKFRRCLFITFTHFLTNTIAQKTTDSFLNFFPFLALHWNWSIWAHNDMKVFTSFPLSNNFQFLLQNSIVFLFHAYIFYSFIHLTFTFSLSRSFLWMNDNKWHMKTKFNNEV